MDGTRSALIVASDEYTDPGLRRLRAPASDARALAGVLRDPGIGGFEVRTLLNEPAHVVNLAVEEFFADRRPGDLLLVHFSCHGVKDEDGELYFAASNTVLGRLGATAVAAEFVSRRMSRSRSRRVVLLLDCCYAGAFERGLVARAGVEMGIKQQFGGRGRAVITASSAMEYAFEAGELADTRELSPSVFTSALVEGLKTGDADRDQDGLVGLDELYDYVYDKVRAATPNQTPGKWTFGVEGELYIARRSHPVTMPAPLPAELQQAIDSPLAGIRSGAVHELAGMLRGRHAGMALAAQLALEQLTGDDSRVVAAAAVTALGGQAPPELALPVTSIDFGQLPLHSQCPERRVHIGNAGGGSLNARAVTSASWLKLRQAGDELVVAVDTSAGGEREGTITVDSDGGTATIRVQARVDPAPQPAPDTATAPAPVTPAAQEVAGPTAGPAPSAASVDPGVTSQAGDDRRPPVTDRPGAGPGEEAPQAPRPRPADRGVTRRLALIAAGVGTVVAGLITAIILMSGTPHSPAKTNASGTPSHVRWIQSAGDALSSPAVAAGTVYISSADRSNVYALDAATGHVRWIQSAIGELSSPAVAAGTVYIGEGGKVYALDAATGHPRWTQSTGDALSSPAVAAGTIYISSADRSSVYALDAATGHLRWTYTTGENAVYTPVVAAGTVYVVAQTITPGPNNGAAVLFPRVYALDAASGHVRWTQSASEIILSSPAVAGGTVYIVEGGKVYALDAATGHVRWTQSASGYGLAQMGGTLPSPVVADGTVYTGGGSKVYALDAATGHVRWTQSASGALSSPAIAGGTVYIGSGDKVYALDAAGS